MAGKVDWLPGPRGTNPRFVVTDIPTEELHARALYERLCCARGEVENRIKERQIDLFADRTTAHELWTHFSAIAGVVIEIIRRFSLTGTELERDHAGAIRGTLLKITGSIRLTTRRVWISLSSAYSWQSPFRRVARRLTAAKQLHPAPT